MVLQSIISDAFASHTSCMSPKVKIYTCRIFFHIHGIEVGQSPNRVVDVPVEMTTTTTKAFSMFLADKIFNMATQLTLSLPKAPRQVYSPGSPERGHNTTVYDMAVGHGCVLCPPLEARLVRVTLTANDA